MVDYVASGLLTISVVIGPKDYEYILGQGHQYQGVDYEWQDT